MQLLANPIYLYIYIFKALRIVIYLEHFITGCYSERNTHLGYSKVIVKEYIYVFLRFFFLIGTGEKAGVSCLLDRALVFADNHDTQRGHGAGEHLFLHSGMLGKNKVLHF